MAKPKIVINENGPYSVEGNVALTRKSQVVSEHGEPLTWRKDKDLETDDGFALCRCGHSDNKPFCDGSHAEVGFDGTETAPTAPTTDRQVVFEGSGIVVKRDYDICSASGFCGNRFTNVEKMVDESDESTVRAQIIAMIERCPSGSFTYSLAKEEADIEPDLPVEIAVCADVTDDGAVIGPLWVTGKIEIERADGKPLETRNRVTLCRCGQSSTKPLCDGTHRDLGMKE